MKSALNIFLMILLGLSVSFCSMFSKDTEEKEKETTQQYDQYSSSGVYNDIEGESRSTSSDDDYSDDSYGSLDEGDDGDDGDDEEGGDEEDDEQLLVSGGDDEGSEEPAYQPSDYPQPDPPSFKTAATEPGNEPLPVEKLEPVKKKKKRRTPRRKKASVSKSNFKNGMYRMGRKCNMRKKPSTKASKVGKVKKGKKLWVEAHNSNWVKVYKKSGAVYLHRSCL